MTSAALFRLCRLLGVVVTAEKARLAGVLARRDACLRRARTLRGEIGAGAGLQAAARGAGAADLAAAARWCLRLAERARAEEARAVALEAEAEAIRGSLARATGCESALDALAEKVRKDERRLAERRAEGAVPPLQRPPGQLSVSSATSSGDDSAGSPGTA